MARNLPWETKGISSSTVKSTRKAKASTPTATKRKKTADSSDDDQVTAMPRLKVPAKSSVRPRSVSPAEETEVELMEEGLENDDVYMMVEDEFLTVAKKFTKQIHQAALDEMEEAAKTKSRETIAALSRPMSIKMPAETRKKLQSAARAKKRGEGVQKLLSTVPSAVEDEDDPDAVPAWVGTSLHGLMESPKKLPPVLPRLDVKAKVPVSQGVRSANYGSFNQPIFNPIRPEISKSREPTSFFSANTADEETASEDDEDDLDAMPKAPELSAVQIPEVKLESLFSKTKLQPTLISGSGMQSFKGISTSSVSSSVPILTAHQSLEMKRPVLSKENSESSTSSSAATGKPTEKLSRIAQIKKRLFEKKRRDEEDF